MYHELRAADFRAAYRLLGECRELWLDPAAWQDHLLGGLSALIHLPVGLRADLNHFASSRPVEMIDAREHGWPDTAAQIHFATALRRNGPFTSAPLDARFRTLLSKRRALTLPRADFVTNAEWHSSETFNVANHPVQMDEMLYSAIRTGPRGRVHFLGFGGAGHSPTQRDCELVDFVHRELLPILRSPLTSGSDYSLHGLSPRRREIFALLIKGLPEKLIADRLGLRPSTVNEQMREIYAHFGVHSRARLMAYVIARRPAARRGG